MKLSVIVPGFGKDRPLAEAQAAYLRGIVGEDAEVLVPDGSNVAEARNNGLSAAKGEWIAWVDADDEVTADWFPEICRAIVAAERDGEIDDIVFDVTEVEGAHEFVSRYGRGAIVRTRVMVDDLLRDLRIGNHLWRHVMRRRLWDGDSFEDLPVLEDYVTLPRVLARARKVAYLSKPLYRYIVRKGSLCTSARSRETFEIAVRRAERFGGPAYVGTALAVYQRLYVGTDFDGGLRNWLRRHIVVILADPEIGWKWRLKFLLAALGVMVRCPK